MAALCILLLCGLMAALTGVCGVEIIGGQAVPPHSRPYMAYILLGRGKSSSCGGFLIREDFVLTAAHCQAQEYHVIIGAHNIEENETSQKVINVKKAFPHPLSKNFENDIMLLKLIKPVVLNREVAVIPLRSRSVAPGTVCSVAGWGKVNQSKSSSNSILQEVNVTVQNYEQCRSTWGGQYDDRKICAGRPDHGTCKGDSGGPLVCDGFAQGIVSFGSDNCKDKPAIYTKISVYKYWIKATLRDPC
ncbi:duodenase-1 [Amia ocellicauda]|uniref:duodenase-1 n=1 Tax=Amia ocellicauda TaxID=2972642 RepID=UPI003464E77C